MKSEVERHLLSNKMLTVVVDNLRQTVAHRTMELEKHKKQEVKKRLRIFKMKEDLKHFSERQLKSDTKHKTLTEDAVSKEQEIVNVRY